MGVTSYEPPVLLDPPALALPLESPDSGAEADSDPQAMPALYRDAPSSVVIDTDIGLVTGSTDSADGRSVVNWSAPVVASIYAYRVVPAMSDVSNVAVVVVLFEVTLMVVLLGT